MPLLQKYNKLPKTIQYTILGGSAILLYLLYKKFFGIETDQAEIKNFIHNSPKEIFNAISDHVQALKSKIDIPAQEVKCTSCETEFLMPVTMDQSNFFAVRS